MTSEEMLFTGLRAWVTDRAPMLANEGVEWHLDDSRAQWGKASLSLSLDREERISQLTVWATGEVELEHAEVATGLVSNEHRDLASLADLNQVLDDLLRWQQGGEFVKSGRWQCRGGEEQRANAEEPHERVEFVAAPLGRRWTGRTGRRQSQQALKGAPAITGDASLGLD